MSSPLCVCLFVCLSVTTIMWQLDHPQVLNRVTKDKICVWSWLFNMWSFALNWVFLMCAPWQNWRIIKHFNINFQQSQSWQRRRPKKILRLDDQYASEVILSNQLMTFIFGLMGNVFRSYCTFHKLIKSKHRQKTTGICYFNVIQFLVPLHKCKDGQRRRQFCPVIKHFTNKFT